MHKYILGAMLLACATTAAAQRIAVLSDVHVSPGNPAEAQLKAAVDEINQGDFDIVVMNGDLTNEGLDDELLNVKSILDRIRHPLYVLPGNHELNWSQSATKTFNDLWGNDRFVTEVDSLVVVGIACGPYMKMGDGHIKQEDLLWLRSTLDSIATPGKRILNFNHYPLQDDLDNWEDYVNLLSAYPVIGHINGHYHVWRQYWGGDIPAVMTRALAGPDGYGYSIVEVDPQWVHVYNKVIGADPEPKYAFAAGTSHKPLEYRELKAPVADGYDIDRVYDDHASVFTRLAFDAANVYFGNSLGEAVAVDKATGKRRWTVNTGASLFSRPVVLASGDIAFPGATGISIISPDGKLRKTLPSREGPYVADGLVTDDAWYQGAYKRFERRNPRTGKLVWTYDSLFNYCQAAPVADAGQVFFGAWDTNMRALDAKTGRLLWTWNNGRAQNQLGPGNVVPAVTPDRIYIVAPDRYMTAIDRATGRTLWRDNSHRYRESLGISADHSRLYAKTMDGELVCIDATAPAFSELWTLDMGIGYDHAPCIVLEKDGTVYAGSRRGIVTAVDPATRSIIWQGEIGKSEINGFDIDPHTGDVWTSLIEGRLARIHKK